ncbi:zinc-ribbon domain-containing protein, partial [bacterium]|nr:zinc-ribbon domain-containing protein [bacterium]
MRSCPTCAASAPDDSRYCPSCGSALPGGPAPARR